MVNTSDAPVACAAVSIDLCSTLVTPFGTHITILGLEYALPIAFVNNVLTNSSAISISEITPSLNGFTNSIESGTRPTSFFASFPIVITELSFLLTASSVGSSITTPTPLTYIRVFAVPKSIAISLPPNKVLLKFKPAMYT